MSFPLNFPGFCTQAEDFWEWEGQDKWENPIPWLLGLGAAASG